MPRYLPKHTLAPDLAIVAALVAVFVADVLTPLGFAVWIAYLVPLMLTLVLWSPRAPVVVGASATVLMIVGHIFSPPGITPLLAVTNRSLGALTVWVVTTILYVAVRNKVAVRKQEWLRNAQSGLSEKMVGEQNLGQLSDSVLSYLASYLDAKVGAFFVDENEILVRRSVFALPAGSALPSRVAPGEGLIGQVKRDGSLRMVDEVPVGYMPVGSSLGQCTPRAIVIAPFKADGVTNAVLELGFIDPPHSSIGELIDRVSESVAVAVRSAKYRDQLQQLLEETQSQAEELQTQSEELRVTNEELQEQSRTLNESHARLEAQQAELEQTNAQLEVQSGTLEAQRDELNRSKTALEQQARHLERVSQYKSEFLANMSHELRTPLNSALILARLLAENRGGNLSQEQVTYAQTIESAGNDLLTLINDVLDLSKVEAGHVEISSKSFEVAALLQHLNDTFKPVADSKGLALSTTVDKSAPPRLETDQHRLEQVLKNLLSNALKFTEKGEVSLRVSAAERNSIAFAVKDTGIGVPAAQHDIIFEPFRQADGTASNGFGGTGLGLSIARQLARALKGDIQVESTPGAGSTFTVTVPIAYSDAGKASEPRASATAAQEPLSDARTLPKSTAPKLRSTPDDRDTLAREDRVVLIVEDDPTFSAILRDLAHEQGFKTLIAGTTTDALALAAQYSPSAVLLDVGLSDVNGLSVLDRLKSDARTRHIPVHVVSASDYSQTAYSLGAIGYMLKPVKRDQLVQAFRSLQSRIDEKLRKVLIVEDDPRQLDSMRSLLSSKEVETVGATSAAECLQKLKTTTFDCMVLDLTLPDSSGFSLLETVSEHDVYSFPPVIVYTGRELSDGEEQRLRRYSKSIIIKGARSPERLLDEVTLFLHQVVSDLPPAQQSMLQKARSRDAVLENRRIMVVEDDVRNIFALTSVLEPRGVKLTVARNGREALELLQKQTPPVELVLMDLMMPEMDGLTATREIRKRTEWRKLPILVLTAKALPSDQEQCLAAGANDYIPKPLDIEKLISLIRVWLPR